MVDIICRRDCEEVILMQMDGISTSTLVNIPGQTPIQHSPDPGPRPGIKMPGQKSQGQTTTSEKSYPDERKVTEEEVINLIEKANNDFVAYDRRFEFSIHDVTRQIMVKVIDATTDEVIRELPPEKVLDLVASLWEAAGIIVDKKI